MGWQTVPRLPTCCTAHHMHADVCILGRRANLLEIRQEGARSAQSQVESCALIGLLQLPPRLLGCALLHCQARLCVVKGPLQAALRKFRTRLLIMLLSAMFNTTSTPQLVPLFRPVSAPILSCSVISTQTCMGLCVPSMRGRMAGHLSQASCRNWQGSMRCCSSIRAILNDLCYFWRRMPCS